jgi:hypothetical protein
MPFPRDAGGPGGQGPAIALPTPNVKSINKIRHNFLISTSFEFFIRTPLYLKSTLGASIQVRFAECDERPGAVQIATSIRTEIWEFSIQNSVVVTAPRSRSPGSCLSPE